MRRAAFFVVLGLSSWLLACGSSPLTLSTAELSARLLDARAVGAGWQQGSDMTPEDLSSVVNLGPCQHATIDPIVAKRLTATTGIQFEPTDHSYKHIIELVVTGAPRQLDSDLQTLFRAADSCTSAPTPPSGATIHRLATPQLGEQTAVYVIALPEEAEATWYVRAGVVRVGSVATMLGVTEILPAQQRPDMSDQQFIQLLDAAIAKMRG